MNRVRYLPAGCAAVAALTVLTAGTAFASDSCSTDEGAAHCHSNGRANARQILDDYFGPGYSDARIRAKFHPDAGNGGPGTVASSSGATASSSGSSASSSSGSAASSAGSSGGSSGGSSH